jgi:hypothetical protein
VCSTTKIEKGCEEAFRVELLILMTRAYTWSWGPKHSQNG